MKRTLAILFILLLCTTMGMSQHFVGVEPNGLPWPIFFEGGFLNGIPMDIGDEIAVFDGDLCISAFTIEHELTQENPAQVVVWEQADSLGLPGFTAGNPILLRYWYAEEEIETEAEGDFLRGDGTFKNAPGYEAIIVHASIEAGFTGTVFTCNPEGDVVEGALIFLNQQQIPADTSDENGQYTVLGLAPGTMHTLRVTHPFHRTRTVRDLIATPGPTLRDINMIAPRGEVDRTQYPMVIIINDFSQDPTGRVDILLVHTGCAELNWTAAVVEEQYRSFVHVIPESGILLPENTVTVSIRADLRQTQLPYEHNTLFPVHIQFGGEMWENPPNVLINIRVMDRVGVQEVESAALPTVNYLHQNFPNPFNPTTQIKFDIASPQQVTLSVFDVMGRKIDELVSGHLGAGVYSVDFNPVSSPTGIYFYKLETAEYEQLRKMVFVK
ncbi:T9SS type A sorting domain-containing protein [bacterium]|nr:T9SS type A sorting domain-containing protein [bacterium]